MYKRYGREYVETRIAELLTETPEGAEEVKKAAEMPDAAIEQGNKEIMSILGGMMNKPEG